MLEVLNMSNMEDSKTGVMEIFEISNWMIPHVRYLSDGILLEDAEVARMVKKAAGWFDIPECIVTDNRTQFTRRRFTKYCINQKIRMMHTLVVYPQCNGQVEVMNYTILHRLKTKLEHAGGSRVDELPSVLWLYRTIPREPRRETPFSLCHGVKAVILVEVGLPSLRVENFDPLNNVEKL
ncbi:hypothetical protein Nepgr_021581 [Nepenthes gracilis]|uniref:Integrase catalytic domain-containing protein n=1 Tax=Nepenthes gracilis TaxID=150966 RepID=A0AAD3XXC5_NEPGR|nr:hypothetical protein Nepgr_021581 [Nepenthes gracilis]